MAERIEVFVEKGENAKLPFYAKKNDAGMDITAAEDVVIAPGETVIVKTGIKAAVPAGYEIQIRPRSGCSAKTPLRVANSPGTIDAGYRGEIGVIITNTSRDYYWDEEDGGRIKRIMQDDDTTYTIDEKGNKNGYYKIRKGDRIAQMVFCKFCVAEFKMVDDISAIEGDRGGGFGSTGTD